MSADMERWIAAAPVQQESYRKVLATLGRFRLMDREEAFPSHATLAEATGLSERTVRRAIYSMRDQGLIMVAPRKRRNGSQTSNVYRLDFENYLELDGHETTTKHLDLGGQKMLAEVVVATQGVTTTTTTGSDTSLSGMRALRARPKIKDMRQLGPEDWDGSTQGAIKDDAPAPTSRRKAKVRSGNDEVRHTASSTGGVSVPTRASIERFLRPLRAAKDRRSTPVEDWNNTDLAHAWRERLWETGQKTDQGSLVALEKMFRKLKADGATNADIEAMSTAFFADARRWQGVPGHVVFRKFLAQRGTLQTMAQPSLMNVGHYARSRPTVPAGPETLRVPARAQFIVQAQENS